MAPRRAACILDLRLQTRAFSDHPDAAGRAAAAAEPTEGNPMGRIAALFYGAIAYAVFLASFLWAVAFVENAVVGKTIDSGTEGGIATAIIVDALLLGLFAV